MSQPAPEWNEFRTAHDIARGLNWVRWKTQNKAELIIAIGPNSVAVAKGENIDAEDAIQTLTQEMDTIAKVLRELQAKKQTHGSGPRPDGR